MIHRYCATGPDQVIAGVRYIVLLADLDVPSAAQLRAAASTIAAAGLHTRIGLTPQPGERSWFYDLDIEVPVHELPDTVAKLESAAVLQHIRDRPGPRRPFEILRSERHLAIDTDHGIGDGHFSVDVVNALFALCDGRTTPWVVNRDSRLALTRALFRNFALHPSQALQAWRTATESHGSVESACAQGELMPWSPSRAVVVADIGPDSEAALNRWRRKQAQNAGSAGVWLYIVRRALYGAGLPMADDVMIAFNCRRYLSRGRTVNGNFIVGLQMRCGANEALDTVAARLRKVTSERVPLAAMGLLSARGLVRPQCKPAIPARRQTGSPASVMYTDMGHLTALDGLPWNGGEGRRSYTGLLDVQTPEGVTVLNSRIGSTRRLSISFNDNVFDRHMIERSADLMSDPMGFLSSLQS